MRALLVAAVVVFALCGGVVGWGKDGHKIVAQVGWNFLSPSVQATVQSQLPNGVKLADIAGLPDNYDHSDSGKWSSDDHYVDIPGEDNEFFMKSSSCTADCVVNAVYNYSRILSSEAPNWPEGVCKTDGSSEPCPLSFLVHYVGDCHQPMHVSYTDDRGGNNFAVSFFGYDTNLHSVWDGQIINRYLNGSKWDDLATELTNWANSHSSQRAWIQQERVVEVWANESFNIVKNEAYNFIPGHGGVSMTPVQHSQSGAANTRRHEMVINSINTDSGKPSRSTKEYKPTAEELEGMQCHHRDSERSVDSSYETYIGDAYYDRALPLVKARLVEGGLRLAVLLTDIYG